MERCWLSVIIAFGCAFGAIDASEGDEDPLFRACIEQCERTGSVGATSIQHCQFLSDGMLVESPWYMQEPLYVQWKQWNCRSDCQYFCMMQREKEREALGLRPVKYHGKWPFKRSSVFQEPVSAFLSALTLVVQFNGWLSFFLLSSYKLPLRPQSGRTYYEFTCLWHIYGLLSMNAWFWGAIFHSLGFDLTEKLDCSSSVALLGFSLILAVLRTFNVKTEASRVMVAAPLLAFVTTHILYLNFKELDYGERLSVAKSSFIVAKLQLKTLGEKVTLSIPASITFLSYLLPVELDAQRQPRVCPLSYVAMLPRRRLGSEGDAPTCNAPSSKPWFGGRCSDLQEGRREESPCPLPMLELIGGYSK